MARQRQLQQQSGEESQDLRSAIPPDDFPTPEFGELEAPPPPDVHRMPAPGGPGDLIPAPQNPGTARGQEGPRERSLVAPRKPMEPTSMAGSSFAAGGAAPSGPIPFEPIGGPGAKPGGGLFGGLGGLKGGGLGVPLDPISDAASDPISSLIQMLLRQG